MNNIFENLSIKLKDSNLTIEQKNELIKKAGEEYSKQIDNELNLYLTKQYIGAALQIGSAAIPLGNANQLGAKLGGQLLTKNLGRKLAQDIGSNAITGSAGSAIYGLGKGISDEKNPILTAAADGILGFGTGAAIGGITGKILQDLKINEINTINLLRKHWGIPFRKASGNPQKALTTLLEEKQGFVPNVYNKTGIGNFDIPWGNSKSGLQHIIERRQNQKNFDLEKFINDIPNTIRNGNVTITSSRNPNTQNIISSNQKLAIANNKSGINRNWLITAHPLGKKASKRQRDWTPPADISSKNGCFSAPSIPELLANININEYLQKNNPAQKINPQISILGTAAINNLINPANIETQSNTQSPVLKIGIEKQVFLPNEKYYSPDHIFTTQDIENMTTEEFTKYEPIIMEQLKHGMISQSPQNYKNYTNPISGENRIYTREDVESMTTNEFSELESQINAQINTIGLPATTDLEYANRFGDDIIYVNSYYRKDGTKVRGYYRSK